LEAQTPGGQKVFMPHTVEMKYDFPLPIVFSDDGVWVAETLQLLQLKVADVLDAFKPFFDQA
jgi:hypothetical protein